MPVRIEQFDARLAQGLAPLYLLAGPEPLLVQEARDKVFARARDEGFEERVTLHVDRHFDWDELGAGGEPSLFARRRIIDLRLPTGKPGQVGGKALVEWCDNPDPDNLLVVSCNEWDKGSRESKWARVMDGAGVRVDIWPIKAPELPGWISSRMRTAGLNPDPGAVQVLAERLEGNLLAADQEIMKLALLKGDAPLGADDVLEVVADSTRFDAFVLADSLLAGNLANALRVSLGLRRIGVPIQMVVGALAMKFGQLESLGTALAKGEPAGSAFRRLRVWQSQQASIETAMRRLGRARIVEAMASLSRIDRQGKGQAAGDPWHELDRLAIRLCE